MLSIITNEHGNRQALIKILLIFTEKVIEKLCFLNVMIRKVMIIQINLL